MTSLPMLEKELEETKGDLFLVSCSVRVVESTEPKKEALRERILHLSRAISDKKI